MKALKLIFVLFFVQSLSFASYGCYESFMNQYDVLDSKSFVLSDDQMNGDFEENPVQYVKEAVARVVENVSGCESFASELAKSESSQIKVSCKELLKGKSFSRSCIAESSIGYFFLNVDMLNKVNLFYSRWDQLMRGFVVILSILLMSQTLAHSKLWSVNEVFEMGEILHSSRYDYDNGIAISFEDNRKISIDSQEVQKCEDALKRDIFAVVAQAAANHLYYIPQEEFNFGSALDEFSDVLKSYESVIRCHSESGSLLYFSNEGEFILSYKEISF